MITARQDAARRYAPLALLIAGVLIVVVGLPSSLTLPQANPSQVLEYAPVPPNGNSQPGGNFAGLGLASSATTQVAPPLPQPGSTAAVQVPSTFRCVIVDGTPHQTEDPLSPPCVPYFSGDNGGSTYHGVSAKQIYVTYYLSCYSGDTYSPTSQGSESPSCGTVVDLDTPPSQSDFVLTRALKRYSVYFNQHYQTYGRHVHMYAYYGNSTVGTTSNNGGCPDPCRQRDAASTASGQLQTTTGGTMPSPFSAITCDCDSLGYMEAYTDAVAQRGLLSFGTNTPEHESFYRQYPGKIWSYIPSIEEQENLYTTWLCQKIVGKPADQSGNATDLNRTRKFGIAYTDDPRNQFYSTIEQAVVQKLQACGSGPIVTHSYQGSGSVSCQNPSDGGQLIPSSIADFKAQNVTSLLWIGEQCGDWPSDANRAGYFPEWFVFGDGNQEDWVTGRWYDSDGAAQAWSHAWVQTLQPLIGRQEDQLCAQALREVDPNYSSTDLPYTCGFYEDLRQLFTGIQVAGAHLTPQSIDQGFHAIPAHPSSSPVVPACYYPQGDYTCVKDAAIMWWDPTASLQGWSGTGCYRDVQGGRRYLAGQWPPGNVDAQKSSSDPCNGYTSNSEFNPSQPTS